MRGRSRSEVDSSGRVPRELTRRLRRTIVWALNIACEGIDTVVYRPAVVKLGDPLPAWWSCQLAKLSGRLDQRWGTGYWRDGMLPRGTCDICKRRASWLVIGGPHEDEDDSDLEESVVDASLYLSAHPLYVCGWCRIDGAHPARDARGLAEQVRVARARSIAWRWRWR